MSLPVDEGKTLADSALSSELNESNLEFQKDTIGLAVISDPSNEACQSTCNGRVNLAAKSSLETVLENTLSALKTDDETCINQEALGSDGNEDLRITLTDLPTEVK